jgi:hypothetical protein
MQTLFLYLVFLTLQPNSTIITDSVTPFFIENEDAFIRIFCRKDYDSYYEYLYYPEQDRFEKNQISREVFRDKSRANAYFAKNNENDDAVFTFIKNKYLLPDSLTTSSVYKFADVTLSLISFDDGHTALNTFIAILSDNNTYICKFDELVKFFAITNEYLLLISDNNFGFSIRKIRLPITGEYKGAWH